MAEGHAETLAERIFRLRLAAGLETQRDLARSSQVAQSTIADLESGRVKQPSRRTAERIAASLRVPVEELLDQKRYEYIYGNPRKFGPDLIIVEDASVDKGLEALLEAYRPAIAFRVITEKLDALNLREGDFIIASTERKIYHSDWIIIKKPDEYGDTGFYIRLWVPDKTQRSWSLFQSNKSSTGRNYLIPSGPVFQTTISGNEPNLEAVGFMVAQLRTRQKRDYK